MKNRISALCLVLILLVTGMMLGGCASGEPQFHPEQTTLAGPLVEVPMQPGLLGLPVVAAVVDGRHILCLMDTGAECPMVSSVLAVRARMVKSPNVVVSSEDAVGNKRDNPVVLVNRCEIGGAALIEFHAVATDSAIMSPKDRPRGTQPLDMVLSPVMFSDVLLTLDYPHRKLTMEKGELPPPDGREILPMQVAAGGRLLVPVRIDEKEVWLLMDTGCSEGLVIPDWSRNAFPGAGGVVGKQEVQSYYGKSHVELARLTQDMKLGRHVIERPLFMSKVGPEPILGQRYLCHFIITIDQKNLRIRFQRESTAPIKTLVAEPVATP